MSHNNVFTYGIPAVKVDFSSEEVGILITLCCGHLITRSYQEKVGRTELD